MPRVGSERGSMPIAMLVVLIIGALSTVLVGTVVVGQRQTRFDQGFEQSIQIAEAGLERMTHLIRSGARDEDFSLAETAAAGGRYRGTADRDGRAWQLTATGTVPRPCPPAAGPSTPCETSRTIALTLTMKSPFTVAAFGRTKVELRGTNSADSYRSGSRNPVTRLFSLVSGGSDICRSGLPADPFLSSHTHETYMCNPTGKGAVATNEELQLKGGVIDSVDRAEVHYAKEGVAAPLAGATGFCGGVTATCASPKLVYFEDPIELDPDPVVPPADLVNGGSFSGTTLPAGRRLYTNVTLDTNTLIQGTPDNPSVVYLTGTLTVPNGAVVNFQPPPSDVGDWKPRPSPSLIIFSAGVGPALRFGNHASFAGAVYAPRATFSGGAAGNVYGSIVTGSISTQGSWNFHYDEALADVDAEARYIASRWTER